MAQALDDALEANMIFLSFTAGRGLPAIGRTWLETWAGRRAKGRSALVAMIEVSGAAASEPSRIESYLRQIAERANMDFFFHLTGGGTERQVYTVETVVQRAHTVTPLLQEILQRKSLAPRISFN